MTLQKATKQDVPRLASLAVLLWPQHTQEELGQELTQLITRKDAVFFLLYRSSHPIGFAQCQLPHDYVEGAASSPVGYLEGIFLKEEERNQGYAKLLLQECEKWAAAQGCREFASDCEQNNHASLQFHLKMGFIEANRITCFVKQLPNNL